MARDDEQVYTPSDEPFSRRIVRGMKSMVGMGPRDINLPDELPDSPLRRRRYENEVQESKQRASDEMVQRMLRAGKAIRDRAAMEEAMKRRK